MKLVGSKNHLGGQILYRSSDPTKNGVFSLQTDAIEKLDLAKSAAMG